MKHEYPFQTSRWLSGFQLLILAFILVVGICGCEKKVKPPDLSLSVSCVNGAPEVQIANDGGAMAEQDRCIIQYEDGYSDGLDLQLDAGQSLVCSLSNLHGGVSVEIEGMLLPEDERDCLAPQFQEMLERYVHEMDLSSLIPAPLLKQDISLCHYIFFLENLAYSTFYSEVVPIDGGMTARMQYSDITGDIRVEPDGAFCSGFLGELTISDIMYHTDIVFESESADFVSSEISFTNLDITVDGPMGILVDFFADIFKQNLITAFDAEFTSDLEATLRPALSAILISEKRCE